MLAQKTRRSQNQVSGEDIVIEAAWLYYHEELTQSDIATRLGVSRATVVSYLQEARERGMVRTQLTPEVFKGHRTALSLCRRFALAAAFVLPDGNPNDSDVGGRAIRGAADWLPSLLKPGDRLGVAWGKTVFDVAGHMEKTEIPGLKVFQIVGSMATPYGFSADICSSIIAQRLSAQCVNLHMPAIMSSARTARIMRSEPLMQAQLDAINHCNKMLFAAGPCDQASHIVSSGVASVDDLAWYRERGAAAVVCGRFIDADGNPLRGPLDERMLGIDLAQMRGREMGILISAGRERAIPTLAAIRGGYVTHLVASQGCAEDILAAVGEVQPT